MTKNTDCSSRNLPGFDPQNANGISQLSLNPVPGDPGTDLRPACGTQTYFWENTHTNENLKKSLKRKFFSCFY